MGRVDLRLHASLRKWAAAPAAAYELQGAATVRELLQGVGVPVQEAAIIIVNGVRSRPETILTDGDTVSVFPLIGGG